MEDVVSILRSCLITSKGETRLDVLNRDYKSLEGEFIPYQKLGFKTLESFLDSVPNLLVHTRNGTTYVDTKVTAETAHIAHMVARQRNKKKRRRPMEKSCQTHRRPNFSPRTNNHSSSNSGSYNGRRSASSSAGTASRPFARSTSQMNSNLKRNNVAGTSQPRSEPSQFHQRSNNVPAMSQSKFESSQLPNRSNNVPVMSQQNFEHPPLNRTSSAPGMSQSRNDPLQFPKKINNVPDKSQVRFELPQNSNRVNNVPQKNPSPPRPQRVNSSINFGRTSPTKAHSTVSPPLNHGIDSRNIIFPANPLLNQAVNNKSPISFANPTIVKDVYNNPDSYENQTLMNRSKLSERLKIKSPNLVFPDKSSKNITIDERSVTIPQISSPKITLPNIQPRYPSTELLPPTFSDPCDQLRYMMQKLKLDEPIYKIIKGAQKGAIYCSVSIWPSNRVSSYPEDARTEEEAKKLAAIKALDELKKLTDPITSAKYPVTVDRELIKQRLIAIVTQHNGVIEAQVPVYYRENYNEILPDDWTNIVEASPMELTFEKNATGDASILWLFDSTIHQPVKSRSPSDVNMMGFIGDPLPPKMVLPPEELWAVYVTNPVNTSEIWVNIIGENYSDKHHSMYIEVSKLYKSKQPVNTVEIGHFYIYKDDESWQRVRVLSMDFVQETAGVFFIDTGDCEEVSIKLLYPMEKRFYDVAPQAVRLALSDLEDLAESEKATDIVEDSLLFKYYYAKVLSREEGVDNDDFVATAILYDTTGEDDVNINDWIRRQLLASYENSVVGPLSHSISQVYISHVGLKGEVYVQMSTDGPRIVNNILRRLMSDGIDEKTMKSSAVTNVEMTEIYLVQLPDGTWMRSKPVASLGGNQYKMLLIDVGGTIIVDPTKLLQIQNLSMILQKFPKQAIRVKLQNIDDSAFDETMVDRLNELAPSNFPVLCKVITDFPAPPVVELFLRNQPENVLVSINHTLCIIPTLERINEDGNNNIRHSKKRFDRLNSKLSVVGEPSHEQICLRPPELPNKALYDVKVTNLVATPGNFFIQPRNQTVALKNMMINLKEFYDSYIGPGLPMDSLREGKLCAAKYEGKWWRACINGVLGPQMVVVYLCDYGTITTLCISDLRPLKNQFIDLTYQAIKCRLHGIGPISVDWSPLTCKRFQELVANKDFVAVIHSTEFDESSPTNHIVNLHLIDVSTETDIKIHEVLVNERRAIYISM